MTSDPVAVAGVSHHTAPIAERERFAFADEVARRLLDETGDEAMLLTTCNRTELYAVGDPAALVRRLVEAAGAKGERLVFSRGGEAAVEHLFGVAAGLDSMIVGEPQILGQVKKAMREARAAGTLGPVLDELVRRALTVGRRARNETALGEGLPSIPKVATGMAKLILGDLEDATLLVVGTGKLGDLTARTLTRAGASEIVVTNRTPEPAAELAERIGGRAEPFEALERLLVGADIVISCTASREPILTPERIRAAVEARDGDRQLVLIDIAVPRDVDAEVRRIAGVRLYDLDDLRGWGSEAVSPTAVEEARAIVREEAAAFAAWRASRAAVPTIRALHERIERILDLELEIEHVPPEEAEAMRVFGRRVLKKLLHRPLTRLREGAASEGEAYLETARDLFGLDGEEAGPWDRTPLARPEPDEEERTDG